MPATSEVQRLIDEGLFGMSAIARWLGTYREGKPTHPSTPARWHMQGITLPDGRKLKLEAIRLNGRLATSKQAVIRFIEAQQQVPVPEPIFTARTKAERRRAELIAAELDAAGW